MHYTWSEEQGYFAIWDKDEPYPKQGEKLPVAIVDIDGYKYNAVADAFKDSPEWIAIAKKINNVSNIGNDVRYLAMNKIIEELNK